MRTLAVCAGFNSTSHPDERRQSVHSGCTSRLHPHGRKQRCEKAATLADGNKVSFSSTFNFGTMLNAFQEILSKSHFSNKSQRKKKQVEPCLLRKLKLGLGGRRLMKIVVFALKIIAAYKYQLVANVAEEITSSLLCYNRLHVQVG